MMGDKFLILKNMLLLCYTIVSFLVIRRAMFGHMGRYTISSLDVKGYFILVMVIM